MKQIKKRALALALALLMLSAVLVLFASCKSKTETLLTFKADGKTYTLSVNAYELLLSRTKGTLIAQGYTANGYSANYNKFWDYTDKIDGNVTTLDDYYRASILTSCKQYLVALYLFDKYDLSLTDEEEATIDDTMEEYVLTDGEGSKTKLNKVLSDYGVNYDILKDVLTMSAKVSAVQNYLGDNLGDNLKAEFLEKNYLRFYQIFFPTYTYVYETDKNGDVIYYDNENDSVLYAVTAFKATEEGKTVYFTDSTHKHYAYDTTNGTPAYQLTEDGTAYETKTFSDSEKATLYDEVLGHYNTLKTADEENFNAAVQTLGNTDEYEEYTDGYYLQKDAVYGSSNTTYRYLDDIIAWLKTASTGEVKLFTSDFGYHIVRKYDVTQKAYELTENSVWFYDFEENLASDYFTTVCQDYIDLVTVNEEVLATVPSMKEIGANYFY